MITNIITSYMITRFDNKNTLIAAMKSGLNLFVGAGFSILAEDSKGNKMPVGNALLKELHQSVGPGLNDLAKYCSIMERKNKTILYDYLTDRFRVKSFDDCYLNINSINIRNIFTTNIDNLIPQIIANSSTSYINDLSVNGDCADKHGINFLPLHGNVDRPERGYVFSVEKIATIYNETTRIWSYLSSAVEKYPTLFIGYKYNDVGVIESLNSKQTFNNAQQQRWIVLHNPTEEDILYFKGIDFSIIISDTKEFLNEIPILIEKNDKNALSGQSGVEYYFSNNIVPKDARNQTQRPIEEFFRGMQPRWQDILRNVIYKTSYYKTIENSIFDDKKHTIIIGSPISGKTTLAMQVAFYIRYNGLKLMFTDLNVGRAEYLVKLLNNRKALIFIENFTDDMKCIDVLKVRPNIHLVCIDRSYNFGYISHLVSKEDFDIINVTQLTETDIQGVKNTIPEGIRKEFEQSHSRFNDYDESFYEFVVNHIKRDNISERYKDFIQKLELESPELAEFLVLCAYMNNCRVPLSMEVAYSYFDDYDYQEVIDMRKQLSDMLKEDDAEELAQNNIDGYRPRSSVSTKAIINYASHTLLAKVMNNLLDRVSYLKICNFNTFKKWAFDKMIVSKAFPNWKEGMLFYERAFMYDSCNPYVLQQGALYLSSKNKYGYAFDWIDRANTMTDNKQFSIRNSHAIILFEANINVNTIDAITQLDKSMEILMKCVNNDRRRTFHAKTYADQALRYYTKFNNDRAVEYLNNAKTWISEEIKDKDWAFDLRRILEKLNQALRIVSASE